jgi:hypothetical protein
MLDYLRGLSFEEDKKDAADLASAKKIANRIQELVVEELTAAYPTRFLPGILASCCDVREKFLTFVTDDVERKQFWVYFEASVVEAVGRANAWKQASVPVQAKGSAAEVKQVDAPAGNASSSSDARYGLAIPHFDPQKKSARELSIQQELMKEREEAKAKVLDPVEQLRLRVHAEVVEYRLDPEDGGGNPLKWWYRIRLLCTVGITSCP